MVLLRFARIDDVAESLMQPAVFSFACWRMCSRGMQHMDVNVEILLRGMREIHPDRAKGEDGEALWKTKMGAGTVDAASGDAKGCCGCEGFVAHVWQGVLREMGCGACCYVHHF
ncbi:hypothetical protein MRB53_014595 [Persea americana]|uniref:Uncharacterized protein n=1 Tax=Persea americana TaxID=3435 RepID=A0ACC2KBA8_PERAE|nr:hypothetical protein MRB53_014595 [Persea americana]